MSHIVCYEGIHTSLGLMQEEYVPIFLPWVNWRIGIEGTLLRPPYSLPGGIEWVRTLDKDKGKHEVFSVLQHTGAGKKASYRYVGHMGVHHIEWPNGYAGTGSIIGDARARGKGCGTEAKLLIQYHAFMILGLRKLNSTVKAFNGASLGHLIKCGYKVIGRHHKHVWHEGEFVDEILLEVFREDWEPIWEKYRKTKMLPRLTDEERTLVSTEIKVR